MSIAPDIRQGVHMSYRVTNGDEVRTYEFSPTPLIQCTRQNDLSGKTETGFTLTVNVTGTLVSQRHIQDDGIRPDGGLDDTADLNLVLGELGMTPLDKLKQKMQDILSIPGGEFRIYCLCNSNNTECGERTYFRFYPNMIGNIEFQTGDDNWYQTIPYSFQMEVHQTDLFNADGTPLYLENIDEQWSIEPVDEKIFPRLNDVEFAKSDGTRVLRLTHTLTATGKKVYGQQIGESRNVGIDDNELLYDWRTRQFLSKESLPENQYDPVDQFTQINTQQNTVITPYQYAKSWIETKLRNTNSNTQYVRPINRNDNIGSDIEDLEPDFFWLDTDGIFNYIGNKKAFNHTRQKGGNENTGQYSVTESWIILVGEASLSGATDEYTLDYSSSKDKGTESVTISGTIQGYQEGDLENRPNEISKIAQAESLLAEILQNGILYQRCQFWLDKIRESEYTDPSSRPTIGLHQLPLNKKFTRNTVEGIITYAFEFDTRCQSIFNAEDGVLSESISFQINYPTDVFAQVTIPGRQRGPLIFSANTQTAATATLSCEIVMKQECNGLDFLGPRPMVIKRVVEPCIKHMRDIGGDIIRVQSDTDNFNMVERRYSANFTFLFNSCCHVGYLTTVTRHLGLHSPCSPSEYINTL